MEIHSVLAAYCLQYTTIPTEKLIISITCGKNCLFQQVSISIWTVRLPSDLNVEGIHFKTRPCCRLYADASCGYSQYLRASGNLEYTYINQPPNDCPRIFHDYISIGDTTGLHGHKLFSSYNIVQQAIILWSQLFEIMCSQTSQKEELGTRNAQNHLQFRQNLSRFLKWQIHLRRS